MKKENILNNAVSLEEDSLNKLAYWLEYEKHTWILGGGIFWVPYGLIVMGLTILALIFTPYMLWHLYRAKWHSSIIVFTLVVLLPVAIYLLVDTGNLIINYGCWPYPI